MSRRLRLSAFGLAALVALILPRVGHANGEPDSIAAVVARVSPAVTRIVSVRPPKPSDAKSDPRVADSVVSDQATMAIGSGFIIDPSGFVATNRHVVEDASSVFVINADGERYRAKLVGMAGKADIALLKIEAGHKLPTVSFGDSDDMRVGDTVIAIGSPFGFDNSVTAGILSAVNRDIMESPFDDYFQTDAAINHGNSGGPLFNLAGQVVGMNSVIIAPTTAWSGLGFSIPSNDLHFVYDRLMKTGQIRAGMLPIYTQQVNWMLEQALGAPGLQGALVSAVKDEGDSMLEGKIKPGDIILSFNGQKVLDPRDLARKAAQAQIASDAALELYRNGQMKTTHVTIQAWPEAKPETIEVAAHQPLGLTLAAGQQDGGAATVTVVDVDPAGTAADSGVLKGDIIVEVQQTPVSNPDQALHIFNDQASTRHGYAAVLVERDKKRIWMAVAVPNP